MRYLPPYALRSVLHLVPPAYDRRPLRHRSLPLVWDPKPIPASRGLPAAPYGAVWAVSPDDPRYLAARALVWRDS